MIVETVYVAIRSAPESSREEADLASVSYHPDGARRVAREAGAAAWQRANPIVRVARFDLREVEG